MNRLFGRRKAAKLLSIAMAAILMTTTYLPALAEEAEIAVEETQDATTVVAEPIPQAEEDADSVAVPATEEATVEEAIPTDVVPTDVEESTGEEAAPTYADEAVVEEVTPTDADEIIGEEATLTEADETVAEEGTSADAGETTEEEALTTYADEASATAGYDTVAPVIESIDFAQNGQTLSMNDTVEVVFHLYDTGGSGFDHLWLYVRNVDASDETVSMYYSLQGSDAAYDSAAGTFTVKLRTGELKAGATYAIAQVDAYDGSNNCSSYYRDSSLLYADAAYTYKYTFMLTAETSDITLTSLSLVDESGNDVAGATVDHSTTYLNATLSDMTNVSHLVAHWQSKTSSYTADLYYEENRKAYYGGTTYHLYTATTEIALTGMNVVMKDGTAKTLAIDEEMLKSIKYTANPYLPEYIHVKSIQFYKADGTELPSGSRITQGETLNVVVTTTGVEQTYSEYGSNSVYFYMDAQLQSASDYISVHLIQDASDLNRFTGTITTGTNTYPTVWGYSYSNCLMKAEAKVACPTFIVQTASGETVLPTVDVRGYYSYFQDFAGWHRYFNYSDNTVKDVLVGSKLTAAELGLPETVPCPVSSGEFLGWNVMEYQSNGDGSSSYVDAGRLEDYPIDAYDTTVYVYPVFSKDFTVVEAYYYETDGSHTISYLTESYNEAEVVSYLNETYGSKVPSELGFVTFKKMSSYPNSVSFEIVTSKPFLTVYYRDAGALFTDGEYTKVFTIEDTSEAALKEKALENAPKQLIDGVLVNGWNVEYCNYNANRQQGYVTLSPNLQNTVVIYRVIDNSTDEMVDESVTAYNVGDTISFAYKDYVADNVFYSYNDDYEDLTGQTSTTAKAGIYYAYAYINGGSSTGDSSSSGGSSSGDSSSSNTGSSSSSSSSDSASAAPAVKMADTAISDSVGKIDAAKATAATESSTVVVEMGKATVVPVAILEAAKGSDVDVVLQMDGYSWTINGKDIVASNLSEINLEVKVNANVIPSETVKALAGDKPTMQLSLTHNGNFGFEATLHVNVGKENANQYGNLYYHDSDGKLVFMNAGKIGADGSVGLSFSHASDYVIVIGENQTPKAGTYLSPKTLDIAGEDVWALVLLFAALSVGFALAGAKRRKEA